MQNLQINKTELATLPPMSNYDTKGTVTCSNMSSYKIQQHLSNTNCLIITDYIMRKVMGKVKVWTLATTYVQQHFTSSKVAGDYN